MLIGSWGAEGATGQRVTELCEVRIPARADQKTFRREQEDSPGGSA
jgi:hypothetical protein